MRGALPADLPQIADVALATGQDDEWGGADPAYMTHLLALSCLRPEDGRALVCLSAPHPAVRPSSAGRRLAGCGV